MQASTRALRLLTAGLALAVVAIGLALAGARAAAAAPGGQRYATLEEAVDAGALGKDVLAAVGERGTAEALLLLDDSAALARTTTAGPDDSRRVLEQLETAFAAQKADVLGRLDGQVEVVRDYDAIDVVFLRFSSPEALLAALNDPQVTGVAADNRLEPVLAQSLPLIRQPAAAAAGATGAGTSVAILDTGVDYTRPAFGSCTAPGAPVATCRVAFAADIAPQDGLLDDSGQGFHGTNVAGISLGVAPATSVLALDVFNGAFASSSDILSAINWVVGNQATYRIRALNLSLADPGSYNASNCPGGFSQAFSSARAVGVLPVVAAGNSASKTGIAFPACTPGAVSVGAVYDANLGAIAWANCTDPVTAPDLVTCFSQSGPLLSMLAPGAVITAAGVTMAGTSQAAPHVAGAAAVLAAAAAPGTKLTDIETALTTSGPVVVDPANGLARNRLDLVAALARVQRPLTAVVAANGALVRGGALSASRLGAGRYEVTFDRNVSGCAYVATIGDTGNALVYYPGEVFTAGGHSSPNGVYVETKDPGGGLQDFPFHLSVACGSATQKEAVVDGTGKLVRGSGAVSSGRIQYLSRGQYEVTFDQNVSACAYTATIGDPGSGAVGQAGMVFIAGGHLSPNGVYVETKNPGGGLQDYPFHLSVTCGVTEKLVVLDAAGNPVRIGGVTATQRLGPGRYEIQFDRNVSGCAYTATIGDTGNGLQYWPGLVFTAGGHVGPNSVYVETKNPGGGLQDYTFHLAVSC